MATLTVRIPDDKHLRLKELAESQGISVNKLIEELSTVALVEFDTYTRFKLMAIRGDVAEGLRILDKLDSTSN
jgi:predicted transcriptional regulator